MLCESIMHDPTKRRDANFYSYGLWQMNQLQVQFTLHAKRRGNVFLWERHNANGMVFSNDIVFTSCRIEKRLSVNGRPNDAFPVSYENGII